MGEDVSGFGWVEIEGPSQVDTAVPPDLYAVPASAMGILPRGRLVTVGVPGSYWLIDETMVIDGPEPSAAGEVYQLVSLAEFGAITLRPHEQTHVTDGSVRLLPWQAPVADLWVYRFATKYLEVDQLEPWTPNRWYANVQTDLGTPPPVRRGRPARELPSVTGRRLYTPTVNGWELLVAVTEPRTVDGEIVVRLVDLETYARASYGQPPTELTTVSLHRLWAF